ncbi:hypothetical protein G7Z17_g1810 [Cylindrodendrum hubeiense]|uniref:LysM domain-containing protein n=1 Tax=Cylindrodendrum hubeiense TaxID=595255 RepID=A0A9P5LF27_9HYPO|nr:hypothetical protein G7Z17_g1810 [Cylindrodendrum hubeiense]
MFLPLIAACIFGSAQLALGAAVRPRGTGPKNPHDSKTTGHCSWWLDYDEKVTCVDLLGDNITIKQFQRWNPSIKDNCQGMIVGRSYCVEATFEPEPEPEPEPTKKPEPSPTKSSNGIETPDSIQPGMVSNCDKFYFVKSGDSCAAIASKHGITLVQFNKWNTKLGSNCGGLWADAYACVSIIGHDPTPSKPTTTTKVSPTNGIKTPSPIQDGMAKNCNKFHMIRTTTTCTSIRDYYHLPLADFYKWNPAVGTKCQALLVNYYVCVSVVGWKPPTPTAPDKGNGIATPTPFQTGMTKNCNKFHLVKKTTTCASIQNYYKITMADFYKWNPAIGSKCTALWADNNVCVGVIGQKPTPTQPPKGFQTPSPIQAGMVKNCKKFHLVKKTTTCASIQASYKITMANLYKWNPAIGSKCTALWVDNYVCVGI